MESAWGQGTTFALYFPCAEAPFGEPIVVDEGVPQGTGRLLLVDDDPDVNHPISILLRMFGYDVITSASSREALALFSADPHSIDLVVTDQTMPGLTGAQLAQEFRRLRSDIPIILCTGFSRLINAEKAQALGFDAFCMKPLTARELAVTIHQVLQQRTPFKSANQKSAPRIADVD